MSQQWFYASGGGQVGPVDTAELRRLASDGSVQPSSLVWRDGLEEWVQASKIKGLFGAAGGDAGFGAAPAEVSGSAEDGLDALAAASALDGGQHDPAAGAGYAYPAHVIPYQGGGGTPVGVTARTVELLRETRPWVMFFGILGFIGAGLYALGGIALALMGMARSGSGVPAVMGLLYFVVAAVFFFPALFLWRYGSRIGSLVVRRSVHELEGALEAQKAYWRLSGIIAITFVVIMVVVIAFAVLSEI